MKDYLGINIFCFFQILLDDPLLNGFKNIHLYHMYFCVICSWKDAIGGLLNFLIQSMPPLTQVNHNIYSNTVGI